MIAGLRDYQERAVSMTYEWMARHQGNPCIVAPTGSGKSWIIAALCEDVLHRWPDTRRILVLSHVKELLQQDADKIVKAWPDAPIGVYSAGLGSRRIERITVAGIQSVYRRAAELAPVDVVIVDEAHLINSRAVGIYRRLLDDLIDDDGHGPRVIGLTATPYRLGQGMITDGDEALFSGIVEPVTITELVDRGFLAPLRSKLTETELNVNDVHMRGGEYIESELAAAVDTDDANASIAHEIVARADGRRSWLVFCTGVNHAEHMRDALRAEGVIAEVVTGKTPKDERAAILDAYKCGEITALTNANVLTTGFDAPDTDLIAFCRPTLSPGLYVQMAGRGMRLKSEERAQDCLVLDFAGNVARHGPITAVEPPSKKHTGKVITKTCPQCGEIVAAGTRTCPACGYEWPAPERKEPDKQELALDGVSDIMGDAPVVTPVRGWWWYKSKSRANGVPMLVVDYQARDLSAPPLREYLCLMHGGYAQTKAFKTLREIMRCSGILDRYPLAESLDHISDEDELTQLAAIMMTAQPPASVMWRRDGRYQRITERAWSREEVSSDGDPADGMERHDSVHDAAGAAGA